MKINESLLSSNIKINNTQNVALAFSGGADSSCLLDLLLKYCQKTQKQLTVLIVNHNLRQEAEAEACMLLKKLHSMKVTAHILNWNNPVKTNIHNAARKERYLLLTNFCKEHAVDVLLTAHHLNDQAETIMHRIFRGTGVKGLAGIRQQTTINGVTIIRPLLTVTKEMIYEYLKQHNLSWIEDHSNTNDRFARSKIRKFLNGLSNHYPPQEVELILSRFHHLAENASRTAMYIQKGLDNFFARHPVKYGFNHVLISTEFLDYPDDLALRILEAIFIKILKVSKAQRLSSLLTLIKHLRDRPSKLITLAGFEIVLYKNKICFFPEFKKPELSSDHSYYTGSLGLKGWQYLKRLGLQKPNDLPHYKILYSIPAKFNDSMQVISVPLLHFSTEEIIATIKTLDKHSLPEIH